MEDFRNIITRGYEQTSVEILSEFSGEKLLDVGCNDGSLTVCIADAVGAREVYGVDVSEPAVETASERGIDAHVLDVSERELPFPDDYFDVVYSGEVVDYITDTERYFAEIRRVLSADGVFLLSTVNLASLHNRLALLSGGLPFPMRPENDIVHSDEGVGLYELADRVSVVRLDDLSTALHRHGFTVSRVEGCVADHQHVTPVKAAVDWLISFVPSLSYRFILLCHK
ncbi:class I SAM-dependent methyltransferase [Halobacteriaceae archaeon GCM10025711]